MDSQTVSGEDAIILVTIRSYDLLVSLLLTAMNKLFARVIGFILMAATSWTNSVVIFGVGKPGIKICR